MSRGLMLAGCLLAAVARGAEPDCVVLLHGIGMRPFVMQRLEAALQVDGYRTVNLGYPSRRLPIEQIAGPYLREQLAAHDVARAPRLHFVVHSMGSLVVRRFLQEARPANLGRVVMLGPPNQGSAAADVAARYAPLRAFFGDNLIRLGTGPDAIARQLGPADFEVGVIAGSFAVNPIFGPALGGPHDGVVSVESARLPGMRDFLVVPYSHTAMLWRREVVAQVRAFLRHGRFERDPPAPTEAPPPDRASPSDPAR